MKPPKETTSSAAQAEWWSRPGIVYFVAAGNPYAAIKIGIASVRKDQTPRTAIISRLRKLQTGNHELLELLGVIPFLDGDRPMFQADKRERELHAQFESFRRFDSNSCGAEWFHSSQELLNFIRDNSQKPESLGLSRSVATLTARVATA